MGFRVQGLRFRLVQRLGGARDIWGFIRDTFRREGDIGVIGLCWVRGLIGFPEIRGILTRGIQYRGLGFVFWVA